MKNSNNTTSVPEAKEAMNKFKMEVANELGEAGLQRRSYFP